MDMYRIVFCGDLIEGFQPQDVRQAALMRFKLSDAQVARMFSGEQAVLKKAVSNEAAQPYLAELARMGMQARLERMQQFDADSSVLKFKVVFWGRTVSGFTRDQVMRAVPRRLPLDQAQVTRLFAGGKAVLKRGVTAEVGARYIAELARIGMQVELEIEQESLSQAARAFNPTASQVTTDEQSYSNFMQTQIDFQQAAGRVLDTDIMGIAAQREAEMSRPPVSLRVPPPPKVAPPAVQAAQSAERLASVIEAAYVAELGPAEREAPAKPELRCTQCGHRQSSGVRCAACGCELPKAVATRTVTNEELTQSLRDEMKGVRRLPGGDLATLMREMRAQGGNPETKRRRSLRAPMLVGGAACLAAVGGWLLLAHH